MPVSSYAPELLELFRVAYQKEVPLPMPDKKTAIRYRFRLHNLRREMRKEMHPLTNMANGVTLSIVEHGDGSAMLLARPADDSFVKALRDAGINPENALSEAEVAVALPKPAKVAPATKSAMDYFLNKT